jgi:hypothetical protein
MYFGLENVVFVFQRTEVSGWQAGKKKEDSGLRFEQGPSLLPASTI